MINWIIGGVIGGLTVFIIVRTVVRMRRGQGSCCGDCSKGECDCSSKT